jgi:hypothetical protein
MSQGVVFYNDKNDVPVPMPINFDIQKNGNTYTVSLDLNNEEYKYTNDEKSSIVALRGELVGYNLVGLIDSKELIDSNLSFNVSEVDYNNLIDKSAINHSTQDIQPVNNWQVTNNVVKPITLQNLSWHLASPPPKGGRRKAWQTKISHYEKTTSPRTPALITMYLDQPASYVSPSPHTRV